MSEWLIDERGARYRMVGNMREYEMIVHTSFGDIPETQLEDATAKFKAAEKAARDRELKQQLEDAARTAGKFCPLRSGNSCTANCALLGDSGCTYTCPSTSPGKGCPHSGVGACSAACGAFKGRC